jgi:hypothetical protein
MDFGVDFSRIVNDVAAQLAAAGRHEPPEVLRSAAHVVLGAHWPHAHQAHRHHHHAKMDELAHRSPALRDLFTHVHQIAQAHPATRGLGIQFASWAFVPSFLTGARHGGGGHGGHAHAPAHAPGHLHPGHHHHPPHGRPDVEEGGGFWGGGPWWGGDWGPEVVVVEAPPAVETDEQRDFEEGPPVGTTTGRAGPVVVVPERAIGEPLGAPLNAAWAGVDGHGRQYLTHEQRRMDAVRPFGDGEPDWPAYWSQQA